MYRQFLGNVPAINWFHSCRVNPINNGGSWISPGNTSSIGRKELGVEKEVKVESILLSDVLEAIFGEVKLPGRSKKMRVFKFDVSQTAKMPPPLYPQ